MEIENLDMKKSFYASLNERQKRHFAAVEAKELGHGGIGLVSHLFKIDRGTIRIGIRELNSGEQLVSGRIRKKGGGRKKNSSRTSTSKSIC